MTPPGGADLCANASGHPFVTSTVQISQVTSNLITLPNRAPCFAAATCPQTPTTGGGSRNAPRTATRIQGVAFTLNRDVAGGETQMTLSTAGGFVSISGGLPLENHTVTVSGSNALVSGGQAGKVTLVSPLWIHLTSLQGNAPGVVELHFEFVPEPGTLLLLVSGAVGLAVIGRSRMRR